jgi:CheY-like chemotaxis protein
MNETKIMTILLVEDDLIVALIEKNILEKNGYNVRIARSGEEAISIFQKMNTIVLVLMDIDLGDGINGADAAEVILKGREVPLIFLSDKPESEAAKLIGKLPSCGFVSKNSAAGVLNESIKRALKLYYSNSKNKFENEALQTK